MQYRTVLLKASACQGSDTPPPLALRTYHMPAFLNRANSSLIFSVWNTKHLHISTLGLTSSLESWAVHLKPRPSLPPVRTLSQRPHFSVMLSYVLFIFCWYSLLPFDFQHSKLSTENKTNIFPSRSCPVLFYRSFSKHLLLMTAVGNPSLLPRTQLTSSPTSSLLTPLKPF